MSMVAVWFAATTALAPASLAPATIAPMSVAPMSLASSSALTRRAPRRLAPVLLSEAVQTSPALQLPPTADDRLALKDAGPSPVLQPREVITTMMHALHQSSWDDPRPYFGFEVALRFLSPTHQLAKRVPTPRDFCRYLRQPHKQALFNWAEYRWEGELTIIDQEAYQQVSMRSTPDGQWTSVRWMLVRTVPSSYPHAQWAVDAVYVAEPDDASTEFVAERAGDWSMSRVTPLPLGEVADLFARIDTDGSGAISFGELRDAVSSLGFARSEKELSEVLHAIDADGSGEIEFDEFERLVEKVNEATALGKFASSITEVGGIEPTDSPAAVVERVMRALRKPNEPYPLHGAEVAIRYCSPTNRASQLSPAAFSQYLMEPWYAVLAEWDEIELGEADGADDNDDDATFDNSASLDVLVKRTGDESWTVVNWQLSRHNGRWLTDALSITE